MQGHNRKHTTSALGVCSSSAVACVLSAGLQGSGSILNPNQLAPKVEAMGLCQVCDFIIIGF